MPKTTPTSSPEPPEDNNNRIVFSGTTNAATTTTSGTFGTGQTNTPYYPTLSGYTCPSCGTFVLQGQLHSCYPMTWNRTPLTFTKRTVTTVKEYDAKGKLTKETITEEFA